MLQLKTCRWSPWGGRPLLQDVALLERGCLCNFVWLIPLPTESGTGYGSAFASVLCTWDRAVYTVHSSGSRHLPVPVCALPVFNPESAHANLVTQAHIPSNIQRCHQQNPRLMCIATVRTHAELRAHDDSNAGGCCSQLMIHSCTVIMLQPGWDYPR